MKRILIMVFMCLVLTVFGMNSIANAREKLSSTKLESVKAKGIRKVRFRDIAYTDFVYNGNSGQRNFEIRFERIVFTDNDDEFEKMISRIELDIETEGETLIVRLRHPKKNVEGFFHRLIGGKEWRVRMEITGPSQVDIDLDVSFSEVLVKDIRGKFDLDVSFSSVHAHNISGLLKADASFAKVQCEDLTGSFDINNSFGSCNISLARLGGKCRVESSFGSITIGIPEKTRALFTLDKSFGQIEFLNTGNWTSIENNGKRRELDGGGDRIYLNTSFGSITVKDSWKAKKISGLKSTRKQLCPEKKSVSGMESYTIKSIKVSGNNILKDKDIRKSLDLKEGETYTTKQISSAVNELSKKSRFISSANHSMSSKGELSLQVHEVKSHSRDIDPVWSFSRVAGLGLGPRMTIKSQYGPVNELVGEGQYHWGNRDWTYKVKAEKHFFPVNTFTIGATYRNQYESVMDWAIPRTDGYLNALIAGLETNNYYEVEGATGYASQSFGDLFTIKAAYFEEKFGSLKKHTNASVGNNRHKKFDNPPLPLTDIGRIIGMRYSVEVGISGEIMRSALWVEAEQSLDNRSDTLDEYTRYLADARFIWTLSRSNFLAVRLAGGHSEQSLPAQKAFRLGGQNTLRGYEFGSIPDSTGLNGFDYQGGGNKMVLGTIEYAFGNILNNDAKLILFSDIGGVWIPGEKITSKGLKRDVGVGLAFGGYLSHRIRRIGDEHDWEPEGLRINWSVPVGNVEHKSRWTLNFVQVF